MIRAPIPGLREGDRVLEGAVGHYLARVLRLKAGSAFVAFDPAGGRDADAVVTGVDGDHVRVHLGPTREGSVSHGRALTWIQGFAKGDKCDAVVRDATELGATRVIIAATRRSVVRLDDSRAAARLARWTRIAEEASRQCGRSETPLVEGPLAWDDALARVEPAHARFCLWVRAPEPLAPALFEALASGAGLAFVCGPEGGLDDAEVESAMAQGWHATSLGPTALRTETVAAAVLGAVRVWSGLFGAGVL
ncbi:MAG TPA: RsmE family RNA methyltransferase [Polyangiaceae bacterium]|nr:RsmE family RNA methyltransferase [Polyangiaceae bacterium]